MKKICVVLLGILCGTTAYADEMRIDLESGNTLLIQYTGTIHGVSLQGDTITAMKTERTGEQKSPVQSAPTQTMTTKPKEHKEAKSKVRFGWADPKMED